MMTGYGGGDGMGKLPGSVDGRMTECSSLAGLELRGSLLAETAGGGVAVVGTKSGASVWTPGRGAAVNVTPGGPEP